MNQSLLIHNYEKCHDYVEKKHLVVDFLSSICLCTMSNKLVIILLSILTKISWLASGEFSL